MPRVSPSEVLLMESLLTGERFLVLYTPPDAEPLPEDENERDTLRDLSPFGAEAS